MDASQSMVLKKEDFIEKPEGFYMTFDELTNRLGFKNKASTWKVYKRFREELKKHKGSAEMELPLGGKQKVACLDEIGCLKIAMLARTKKGAEFRHAVANFISDLIHGRLSIVEREKLEKMLKEKEYELAKETKKKYEALVNNELKRIEIFTRKKKGLNFTNAKIIMNLRKMGMGSEDISEATGVSEENIRNLKNYHLLLNGFKSSLSTAVSRIIEMERDYPALISGDGDEQE